MKKNTYVTAALFVLFGLLTVTYFVMGDGFGTEPELPGVEGSPYPAMTFADDVEENLDEEEADQDAMAEAKDETNDEEAADEDADALAEAESDDADTEEEQDVAAKVDEDTEEADEDAEGQREVMSKLDLLRASREDSRTELVGLFTGLIASNDVDPETKNEAKESLNELQTLANSSRTLEGIIVNFGFEDVVVNATTDSVRVMIGVNDNDFPSRETLAELFTLAGIEFGNHRASNISIDFQPLN